MRQIVQVLEQQQAINDKITRQVPIIVQKSVQEQPQKPKRKGFLGIFGKKEKPKPTVTTTMLRSLDRDMIAEQQAQSRRLSEHTDNLVARNAELNRQLHGFIRQMDKKVQADLQKREAEITAMREQSLMQIGSLTGFVFLLLVISYIIIHRNANRIKRYKQKTTDLIGQLQQSVEQNEELIASRKKAVHTITHELRTPLTAIIGYTSLMEKGNDADKKEQYVRNIRQSSERMREMLNTLLSFFRLDNGKDQLLIPKMIKHGFPLAGMTFDWDNAATYTPEQQRELERMLLQYYTIDEEYFIDKYKVKITGKREDTSGFFE